MTNFKPGDWVRFRKDRVELFRDACLLSPDTTDMYDGVFTIDHVRPAYPVGQHLQDLNITINDIGYVGPDMIEKVSDND